MSNNSEIQRLCSEAVGKYLLRNGFESFRPKAALIDMDGTLIDSMGHHALAWHRMMSELGVKCTPEEFFLYEGRTGASTIKMLFRRDFGREATDSECVEYYARKTRYFNEMPRVGTIEGARRMVDILIDNNITRVLVTGSGQLSSLERLKDDFPGGFADDLRITSHSVTHCKPHPEPYLKGMELAGVEPWQSIVVENAPLGVESGVAAKAFTVAVTTGPIPAQAMWDAGADMVFDNMNAFADALPTLLYIGNNHT